MKLNSNPPPPNPPSALRKSIVSSVAALVSLTPFFGMSAGVRRVLGQSPTPTPTTTSSRRVMTPKEWPPYDLERQRSDQYIATLFGDPGAVAAANGFEPSAMHGFPFYRGPWSDDDKGAHLGAKMHLYGSADGNGESALYLPPGFRYVGPMLTKNGKDNGGHTFFYKELGSKKNVYLLAFHVGDFEIDPSRRNAAGSIRVGVIGGPGGVAPPGTTRGGKLHLYRHAHIEFSPGGNLRRGARLSLSANEIFVVPDSFQIASSEEASNTQLEPNQLCGEQPF